MKACNMHQLLRDMAQDGVYSTLKWVGSKTQQKMNTFMLLDCVIWVYNILKKSLIEIDKYSHLLCLGF